MNNFCEYASHREALQGRADDFLDAFPLLTDTSRNARSRTATPGAGGDARSLATGRSIRAWDALCGVNAHAQCGTMQQLPR